MVDWLVYCRVYSSMVWGEFVENYFFCYVVSFHWHLFLKCDLTVTYLWYMSCFSSCGKQDGADVCSYAVSQ